jgi:hypothetical protein
MFELGPAVQLGQQSPDALFVAARPESLFDDGPRLLRRR